MTLYFIIKASVIRVFNLNTIKKTVYMYLCFKAIH